MYRVLATKYNDLGWTKPLWSNIVLYFIWDTATARNPIISGKLFIKCWHPQANHNCLSYIVSDLVWCVFFPLHGSISSHCDAAHKFWFLYWEIPVAVFCCGAWSHLAFSSMSDQAMQSHVQHKLLAKMTHHYCHCWNTPVHCVKSLWCLCLCSPLVLPSHC